MRNQVVEVGSWASGQVERMRTVEDVRDVSEARAAGYADEGAGIR